MKKTSMKLAAGLCAGMMLGSTAGVMAEETVEYPDIEYWYTNEGYLPVEIGSETYNLYKESIGVGLYMPYVDWNGGQTYREQLAARVAADDTPDIFLYNGGIENAYIMDGVALDLTDLLEEKCPHLWEAMPAAVWETVRANDPTGEGRIWMIPDVFDFTRHGAYIRTDWLKAVNMEMPTTQEEYVEVLRAFKSQDPNGNGLQDEIPAGGRAEARWMDYLFQMYGIAMYEGYPDWDIYDGEITYSAVTSNMKAALEFVAGLYAEGLLDPETLLNSGADWSAKMDSNIVGVYYHIPWAGYQRLQGIYDYTEGEVQAQVAIMPVISADGYEAYVTKKPTASSGFMLSADLAEDELRLEAALKVIDASFDEQYTYLQYGVEGMHYEMVDGEMVKLPEDKATQELILLPNPGTLRIETTESTMMRLETIRTEENGWMIDQAEAMLVDNEPYGKIIAGDGLPSYVYEDCEDISARTLWIEYASKIITGEYSIDKFDEFVERWYANGGQTVTDRVREWYAGKQ